VSVTIFSEISVRPDRVEDDWTESEDSRSSSSAPKGSASSAPFCCGSSNGSTGKGSLRHLDTELSMS
jgi:hypothetical protein